MKEGAVTFPDQTLMDVRFSFSRGDGELNHRLEWGNDIVRAMRLNDTAVKRWCVKLDETVF